MKHTDSFKLTPWDMSISLIRQKCRKREKERDSQLQTKFKVNRKGKLTLEQQIYMNQKWTELSQYKRISTKDPNLYQKNGWFFMKSFGKFEFTYRLCMLFSNVKNF